MLHRVRLGPRRSAFYCPFTGLHLSYPHKVEGVVDDRHDLTYVMVAIRSGSLIDVDGTLTGRSKRAPSNDVPAEPVQTVEAAAQKPLPTLPAEHPQPEVEPAQSSEEPTPSPAAERAVSGRPGRPSTKGHRGRR